MKKSDFSNVIAIAKRVPRRPKSDVNPLYGKTVSWLEKRIWDECRRIVRATQPNICYTCGARDLTGSNWHTGHYFPNGALGCKMKYDLRILRSQCMRCNIHYGGMGGVFRERMKHEIGVEAEQKLFEECQRSKGSGDKAKDWYVPLLEDYRLRYRR